MIDLSSIANPYDFANPVSRLDLFFGRTDEMAEIRYYLNHAKVARRPINVALLGQRAAGKTSILNIAEIETRNRSFCAVRVDLDESDASTPLMFFFKLFDSLLTSACEMGGFNGMQGKTYETYLNVVNAYEVPTSKEFCPFLFPIQYALAMREGNSAALISDQSFKKDLGLISGELNTPVVLMFDEGNILGLSRVLLEKVRNLFMNTPGYMLLIAGTPELFPVMDQVFSPIVRQFKKISIKGYQNEKETAECIRGPLQVFRIPLDVPDSEITEIHQLSNGRPYEIQLICHLLFRRVQQRRASGMRLDLSTLEELRGELERSQDISGRPIVSALRALSPRQLDALGRLTQCNGTATFEQIWELTYISQGSSAWSKDQLSREFEGLRRKGILDDRDGPITFAGDQFDRLFAKYLAAENKVRVSIQEIPLETALVINVLALVQPNSDFVYVYGPDIWRETTAAAAALGDSDGPDIFEVFPRVAEELYFQMITAPRSKELSLLYVAINLPWASTAMTIYPKRVNDDASIEKLKRNLSTMKNRVENLGGSFMVERRAVTKASSDQLHQKVSTTQNEYARLSVARQHTQYAIDCYDSKPKLAVQHANLALKYHAILTPRQGNNIGYILMRDGDCKSAEPLLKASFEDADSDSLKALVAYNLAVLHVKTGRLVAARDYTEQCVSLIPALTEKQKHLNCLEEVEYKDGRFNVVEVSAPNLEFAATGLQKLLLTQKLPKKD
jgi:hypothetical protein